MTEIKTALFKKAQSGRDHFSIGVISNMGILDNLEAYLEYTQDQCFYCHKRSKYTDIAPKDSQSFMNVSVCQDHFVQDVTS
jgi:molybdopterin-guanine dinucleotide biosynthesis protein A